MTLTKQKSDVWRLTHYLGNHYYVYSVKYPSKTKIREILKANDLEPRVADILYVTRLEIYEPAKYHKEI